MFLPRIKKQQDINGKFVLPKNIKFSADQKYTDKLSMLMDCFFPDSKVEFTTQNPDIVAVYKKQDNTEAYRLTVNNNAVTIEYEDYKGIRNALATLCVGAEATENGFVLDCTDIYDYPVASHRGVLLDLGRGIKPFDILLADVIFIAKAKMNYLHLHLSDRPGVCVKLDCLPEECCLNPCYTKEQMKHLVTLCEALALEIIPEFDMPGHSTSLVSAIKNIDCDVDENKNTHWTVCPSTEETYTVYENIIKELCDLFPGQYFHIGGDELEFGDVLSLNALCHWNECSKCQEKLHKENITDRQELYYYFINRIYGIVKKTGRRMIMWSDQIDCKKPPKFHKDILMQFWRIAAPKRGPYEDCSFNAQLSLGYEFINSYFPETYIDCHEYMSPETLRDWRWDKRPFSESEYKGKIIGSEACAWEYGNDEEYPHYSSTLAPSVMLMADKLWNGDEMVFGEEYEKSLTKAVLGIGASYGINIFKCFGSLMPPRNKQVAEYEKITVGKDEIKATLNELNAVCVFDFGSKNRKNTYINCIKQIIKNIN